MSVPNPESPSFKTWRGVSARNQKPDRRLQELLSKPSKGLMNSLPVELRDVARAGLDPVAVTKMGVTLRGLRKLRTRLRLTFGEEYDTMTTGEVNVRWVKEVTKERQCRLLEMGQVVEPEDVGLPMYFISHAWKNKISLLLEFILDRFLAAADGSVAVWLDILAVNQHDGTSAHRKDIAAFEQVVRACTGGTIVVMDVANCNPATRGWCIYEWAATRARHGPDGLHMWLEPNDRGAVYGSLDIRQAECQFPADKAMILATVEAQHGSAEMFNTKLKLQLLLEPLSYRVDERRLLQRAKGTTWDFGSVAKWLDAGHERGSRVLCVTAGAGEGKSTISAALCTVPAQGGFGERIAAHHFIKYSDQRRLDPVRTVKSLAFQLATRFPQVCLQVLEQDAVQVSQEVDSHAAFEALLRGPLAKLAARAEFAGQQVVILLDALDEADPPPSLLEPSPDAPAGRLSSRPTTPRPAPAHPSAPQPCSNKIVHLLTSLLTALPSCVRFILTTRPDAVGGSICGLLDRTFAASGGVTYLKPGALRRATGGSPAGSGAAADGGILVYRTVVGECLKDGGPVASLEGPPQLQDLYNAYQQVFARGLSKLAKQDTAPVRTLLAVLLAAQEPLPQSLLHAMGLGGVLHWLPGYPVTYYAEEHHVYTLHKSLADWLTDPWVINPFKVDLLTGHRQLAQTLLLTVRKGGSPSPYALKYLVRHLVACRDQHALEGLLYDYGFLAAVFNQGYGHTLIRDLLRLEAPSQPVADAQRWLLARQHELVAAKSEADVVATALRCPLDTLVYAGGRKRSKAMVAACGQTAWQLVHALGAPRRWPATRVILEGHTGIAPHCSWSPDGRTLASASWDHTLRLWDTSSGECLAVLKGHTGKAKCVDWSPSGRMLASCGEDKTVRLWDSVSGECVMALEGHAEDVNTVCWSPDGKTIASGANDQSIQLWEAATGTNVATLEGHDCKVNTLAWSPDGTLLASGGGHLGFEDTTVLVWDVASKQIAAALTGHEFHIEGVAFSPDGLTLASASHDETVRLWSVADAQLLAVLQHHTAAVSSVAWSKDGHTLATASWDKTVCLVDAANHAVTAKLEGHMHLAWHCQWSPDNKSLASCGSSGRCRLWSVPDTAAASQASATSDPAHTTLMRAVTWSPDGKTLASASSDATARIWDSRSGICSAKLQVQDGKPQPVNDVAFSPDGRLLATASNDKTARIWSVETGACTAVLEGHKFFVQRVAFSPDGSLLASSSWDGQVLLWDMASGTIAAALEGHTDRVLGLAWSPNGRHLASCGGAEDKGIKLWSAEGKACFATLSGHTAAVNAVGFSPDGKTLASGSDDGTVRLWEMSGRTCTTTLKGFSGGVAALAWSPSGDALACATEGMAVEVRDIAHGGAVAAVLQGHSASVTSVAWSPDGKAIASASTDKSIRVFVREE